MEEVHRYCPLKISLIKVKNILDELLKEHKIFTAKNYFFLNPNDISKIEARTENEIRLTTNQRAIRKYAKLVSSFPFVECVFISGSVSKGLLSEDGDVDYFIIAKKGRVWFCRTLLILFKKIVLLNSKKYFCVNYFVDTESLRVPDSNLFVATEIKTLIPVNESKLADQFFEANNWTNSFLPNCERPTVPLLQGERRRPWLSRVIESIGGGKPGDRLDNYFLKKTLQRWQKKFSHFNSNDFDLNMRSYKTVSKHHPQGYQNKVLEAMSQKMKRFGELEP